MKTIEDIRHHNLLLLIEKHGSIRKLAELIDRSESQVGQWKNRSIDSATGKQRNISSNSCRLIEQKLGLMNNWMDTDHSNNNVQPIDISKKDMVPLISWVQAGSWSNVVDIYQPGYAEEWYICPVPHSSSTFALKVVGISMFNGNERPSFSEGDIIFIDPQKDIKNKSLIVVRDDAVDEATFKQLVIEGGFKYLKPLNPDWPEKIIEMPETTSVCGVVIAKLEKF